jgi:hypothetical protein
MIWLGIRNKKKSEKAVDNLKKKSLPDTKEAFVVLVLK